MESATAPQTAVLFGLQWNMRAIRADAAWAGGALGSSGVSVAILDTGIDYQWPDLSGRVDLSRSISLRPDEDARLAAAVAAGFFPAFLLPLNPITDLNAHGTLDRDALPRIVQGEADAGSCDARPNQSRLGRPVV